MNQLEQEAIAYAERKGHTMERHPRTDVPNPPYRCVHCHAQLRIFPLGGTAGNADLLTCKEWLEERRRWKEQAGR